MEAEEDIQTRYEIYGQLEEQRQRALSPDIGHVMLKETWERIDWLLDSLVDLNGINSLIDTETQV